MKTHNRIKTCNTCAREGCKVARQPTSCWLEGNHSLSCFLAPRQRNFKLPELVSRITIENPNNPVLQILREYA